MPQYLCGSCQQMIRITVQLADISPSQSAGLGKLPVISHPAENRRLSWPNYMVVSWFYPTNYASSSITHYKKTTFSTGTHRTLHVLPMMCYINWQKCLHLQMPQLSYRFEKNYFFFTNKIVRTSTVDNSCLCRDSIVFRSSAACLCSLASYTHPTLHCWHP